MHVVISEDCHFSLSKERDCLKMQHSCAQPRVCAGPVQKGKRFSQSVHFAILLCGKYKGSLVSVQLCAIGIPGASYNE